MDWPPKLLSDETKDESHKYGPKSPPEITRKVFEANVKYGSLPITP